MSIREALYFAAYEDIKLDTFPNAVLEYDRHLLYLMEARKALLSGRIDDANLQVDTVMQERPDLEEAYLVKIDVLIAQGKDEEARNLFFELEQRSEVPVWIKEEMRL